MRKTTYKKVKILSVILGLFYWGGIVWYGELFFSRPFLLVLLLGSTGVSLLVVPWLSDAFLRSRFNKLLTLLVICAGVCGSLYMLFDIVTSKGFLGDLFIAVFQNVVIITVLVVLGKEISSVR